MSIYLSTPQMGYKRFNSHHDLAEYMYERARRDNLYVVCVLFYKDTIRLMGELVAKKDINVISIDVSPEEYDGYDREYYVSLTGDMCMGIEPAYSRSKELYLITDADMMLIHGDANSRILGTINFQKCKEIDIGLPEYDEADTMDFQKCKKMEIDIGEIDIGLPVTDIEINS